MRLFFISLVLALLCLQPEIADLMDWQKIGIIGIPYTGLYYMKVFFHELGHTVTMWSYGQPAVPAFNFVDGGGVAHPLMERSLVLQGIVYAGFAGFAIWLLRNGAYALLAGFAVFTAIHVYFAFGDRYNDAVSFMGDGGATIMGCYCMFRAAANWSYSEHSPQAERYLNMIFGIFCIAQGMTMSLGLIFNDLARQIYLQGIGGHLTNDFSAIADRMDTRLENVAWFALGFIGLSLTVTAVLLFFYLQEHPYEERAKLS